MSIQDAHIISCIMPTRNRRQFIPQAIGMFEWQDYPLKELIVVDDGDDPVADILPDWVNYIHLSQPLSIGMKRNVAVAMAQGDIIAHFDDDDWYGPNRLSRQLQPIADDEADITGLTMDTVINLNHCQAWKCSPRLNDEIFACGVHGGTLMYMKNLWRPTAMFDDISSGEDGGFLRLVIANGARLGKVENDGDFIYMRHGGNMWPLPPYHHYQFDEDWQRVDIRQYLDPDAINFYFAFQLRYELEERRRRRTATG